MVAARSVRCGRTSSTMGMSALMAGSDVCVKDKATLAGVESSSKAPVTPEKLSKSVSFSLRMLAVAEGAISESVNPTCEVRTAPLSA